MDGQLLQIPRKRPIYSYQSVNLSLFSDINTECILGWMTTLKSKEADNLKKSAFY